MKSIMLYISNGQWITQILHKSRWDIYETSLFYKSPSRNAYKNQKFAKKFLYLSLLRIQKKSWGWAVPS